MRSWVRSGLTGARWAGPLVLLASATASRAAGQWAVVDTHTRASFRGLSVAPGGAVWAGGTGGLVVRSAGTGATWHVDTVPGARSFDFRGAAAIDELTAYVVVASTDTGRIYRTSDGGATWTLQYDDERPGVFLDGIACWTAERCIAAGDPIEGRFMVLATSDGGAHWRPRAGDALPTALPGEAAFAASNSSVVVRPGGRAWLATGGGPVARVWRSSDFGLTWAAATTAVTAGAASAGIFSLAFCDERRGVAVGGDYRRPTDDGRTAGDPPPVHVAITEDGGATWSAGDVDHNTPYLSGVTCLPGPTPRYLAVGPAGTFESADGARHWTRRDGAAFNAVAASPTRLVAVGADGAVAVSSPLHF